MSKEPVSTRPQQNLRVLKTVKDGFQSYQLCQATASLVFVSPQFDQRVSLRKGAYVVVWIGPQGERALEARLSAAGETLEVYHAGFPNEFSDVLRKRARRGR